MDFGGEELLLPIQWQGMHRGEANAGERAMLTALLTDAVECFQGTGTFTRHNDNKFSKKQRMRDEAECWLFGDEPAYVTFTHVCEALEIDVVALRLRLRRWEAEGRILEMARVQRGSDHQRICPKRARVAVCA